MKRIKLCGREAQEYLFSDFSEIYIIIISLKFFYLLAQNCLNSFETNQNNQTGRLVICTI